MMMKIRSMEISMEALSPLMEEILGRGESFELTVTGGSMRPMLLHRVSRVRLAPPRPLQRGDLPLYRRKNGMFVLHRVMEVTENGYTLCGDAQWNPERGVKQEQIIAVATDFARRSRWIRCDAPGYEVYWRVWLWLRPLRRLVFGGWRRIKRTLRRCLK